MKRQSISLTLVLNIAFVLFHWQSVSSQTNVNLAFNTDFTWKALSATPNGGFLSVGGSSAWMFNTYNASGWPNAVAGSWAIGGVYDLPAVQHIWNSPYNDSVLLRKEFVVPVADNYTGTIQSQVDNQYSLYFNGTLLGAGSYSPTPVANYNIAPSLQGCVNNVVAMEARNWGGPYGAKMAISITAINVLNPPVADSATNITCNSFTANWDTVPTADLYLLDVSNDPTFATYYSIYNSFNVGNVLSYNLTSLPAPATYYYRLRAQRTNAAGLRISCYSNVITVNLVGGPLVNAGNDAYICPGSSTSLNGSGTGTPTWSPSIGLSSTGVFNPAVTPPATQTYVLSVNNAGCVSTDSVTITIGNIPPLSITPDSTICPGDCIDLVVAGGDYFVWSPFPGMVDSSLTTQPICPAANTTYTVTSYTVGPNLIVNGNFSGGNAGFSSSYTYAFPNTTEGQYYVGPNPQLWNGGLSPCVDHTSGTGNMMMVNGSPIANTSIWCQTVPVSTNTDYLFSTWVTPAYAVNMPILQFSINGTPFGSNFSPSGGVCTWEEFFTTWNSGVNTSATICIVNQNTNISGNDFGIDDISFSPVCTQTGTVNVTLGTIPAPAPTNTGPYCAGDTIQLNSPGGFSTDDWTGPAGYNQNDIQNPTIPNSTVAMSGDYTVTVTNATGCSATGTTTVVVNLNAPANANNSGPYCETDTIFLSSGPGFIDYDWSGPGGFSSLGNQNPDIPLSTVPMTGTYTVLVTAAGGCTGTATTYVTVNAQPLILANTSTPICNGSDVTLNGNGAFNYTWTGPNGFSATGQSPVINNIGPIDNGIYTVTGTDANNCSSTATLNVVSLPNPTAAFAGDNLSGCVPLCVNFTDQSTGNGGTITGWSWNIQGQAVMNTQNSNVCFGNAGTYDAELTVTTSDGCSNTLTLNNYINVSPYPTANFTYAPQQISIEAPDINFGNTSTGAVNYVWSFGDGGSSIVTSPQHTYPDTGTYCVNLIASNGIGCADTVTHCLIVNPVFTLYIPNAFTPNLDNLNEVFMIYGQGIKTVDVRIFDRWGEEIFNFTSVDKGWDGKTRNGGYCPQGTYVFRVEVVDILNKPHQYTGMVNLIR